MTEFNLTNGQAIELTKDGILIRGNRIEIEGNVTVIKDDKHANIMEQDDEGTKISIVNIDDEPKPIELKPMEPKPISYGRLAALEAKLSTAITEIDKLKTTIKAERALTDQKITDAVIKWTVNGK
ncbi:hypothetical protein [Leuconostoc citreum]|uniref:hypothetical protein n=1 Tax=Leuconostoc citreum TaxID=33964 RepID=UPI002073A7D4|nr:hypothetical protein [Leuconostoc citreum]